MLKMLKDEEIPNSDLAVEEELINQLELYAVGIAISLFSEDLKPDTWLVIATDNMTAYHWMKNMKAKGRKETKFIRNLVLLATNRRVRVNVSWIRTNANKGADDLSRMRSQPGEMLESERVYKSIQDIKEQSTLQHILRGIDPTCRIDIQAQVAIGLFQTGNQVANT